MKIFCTILFIGTLLAQLFVPAQVIFDHQKVLNEGKLFRFELEPIDPNDPFRGKYIILNFKEDKFVVNKDWSVPYGEAVFARIAENEEGFAVITNINKIRYTEEANYISVNSAYTRPYSKKSDKVTILIEYPFDFFYMEENKAPIIEQKFRDMRRDSSVVAWADVKVLNGKAVVEEVKINGISVKDFANE